MVRHELDFLYPLRLGGGERNRKPETEAKYRVRYLWLQRRACAEFDRIPNPYEFARWVAGLAASLRSSAFRQYQAATIQLFRDLANEGALCTAEARVAVMVLRASERRHRPSNNREGKPDRCGSGRAKQLSKSAQKALVVTVRGRVRKTFSARVLESILVFGPLIGIRPWEWADAVVDGRNLLVRSAKFSLENGIGLEPIRELRLDPNVVKDAALKHLEQVLRELREEVDRSGKECVMRRVSRLLARIRPDTGAPRATMRTTRHQARSNMKGDGVSDVEIAVIFGHASAATAQAHYGVRRGGWGTKTAVSAAPELKDMVRKASWRMQVEDVPDISAAMSTQCYVPSW